jgi:hypothetical protein
VRLAALDQRTTIEHVADRFRQGMINVKASGDVIVKGSKVTPN